jgi:hypothetical protein
MIQHLILVLVQRGYSPATTPWIIGYTVVSPISPGILHVDTDSTLHANPDVNFNTDPPRYSQDPKLTRIPVLTRDIFADERSRLTWLACSTGMCS